MDVNEHARTKWHNFVQRFLPELQAAGFAPHQLATPWAEIATYITLAWMYRPLVEEKDEQALRALVLASQLDNTESILRAFDALNDDKRALFWRYVRFFFNTVLC